LLIDTRTLLRTLQVRHPQYETVARALETLPARGRDLHIVPQNLVELWVVATRPVEQNGLGMEPAAVAIELTRIKSMFERDAGDLSGLGKPGHSISGFRQARP
jgi:hypothetical protein